MPKVYSWRVQNIFQTILLLFSFFHHFFCIFCWIFEDLTPKMRPKWPNLWCGKPWKSVILRKFWFLKAVMVLGCPKCILGSWEKFDKFLKMFYFFITSWSFCKRILKFYVHKSPQNATIWCSLENPEKKKRNSEKTQKSWFFEVCSGSIMHRMNSWRV